MALWVTLLTVLIVAGACATTDLGNQQVPQGSSDPWRYPVRLGNSRSGIHRLLGAPTRVTGELEEYPGSGVTVWFDSEGRATKLQFAGAASRLYSTDPVGLVPADRSVMDDLGAQSSEAEFLRAWGSSLSNGDERSAAFRERRRIWRRVGYVVDALFLGAERRDGERSYPEGTLVWFEVFKGM